MEKLRINPIIGIDSFSDLKKQVGFHQDVKLTDERKSHAEVIQPYHIVSEMIHCGLTCNQKHNNGYLIRFADGTHTNVGRDCGSKHFGASDFDAQIKRLEKEANIENNKRSVNRLIDLIPDFRRSAHDLWHQSKPHNAALKRFRELYPKAVDLELRARAWKRITIVESARKMSDKERMAFEHTESLRLKDKPQTQFVYERKGDLQGLDIFIANPITLLKNVKELLEEIEQSNNDIGQRKIAVFSKYQGQIEEKLRKVRSLISEGKKFFTEKNFSLLPLLLDGQHRETVERVVWDFTKNDGRPLTKGQQKRRNQKQAS